ncbi:macrophage mannose receptor 1-like [Oryzias latipes]|uniref:macrophage mannose receptor 1-like n=1 Tax=Oryzias latipes TaxID=8090 RepID=UPI0005CC4271|nr:macrophage mannose receptor 1-like [Oryzias latipes]
MMEKILLLVLVFSEVFILSSCLLIRQYHIVNQPLDWTEAQTYCREKYTDLATVENSDEMNQLINTISSAGYKDNLWIGLYNEINYRWSDGFIGSYTGNTYSYGTSQDSFHYRSHQICMRVYWNNQNRFLYDSSCSSLYPFVCNNGTHQNPQYVFVNESVNWSSAQRSCRQNFTDLATVKTSTDWTAISSVMPVNQDLWIGVYRDSNISWSDGSLLSFYPASLNFYIQPGVISARCGFQNGLNRIYWYFYPCETKYPFICHGPKVIKYKRVVKLRLKTENSADLNDAAVKAKLLEELQKKLEENGVNGVKVKWKQQTDGKVFNKEEKKKTEL